MYSNLKISIPIEKRHELNQKILHLINNNIDHPQINRNMIFNCYSGQGGLHGLNFDDYGSYHAYSEAKKEVENGAFFTPLELSRFSASVLQVRKTDLISDMTAGHGSLINWLPSLNNVYVNEFDLNNYKVLRHLFPETIHSNEDIRNYNPNILFNTVIGNPPFNLRFKIGGTVYTSQFYYMLKAHDLLKPAGLCAVIVNDAFLKDDFINGGEIKTLQEKFNFIVSIHLPRNIFKDAGADIETKILVFQKKSEHIEEKQHNRFDAISLNDISTRTAKGIHQQYIKPLYDQQEEVKGKLILEAIKEGNEDKDDNFEYRVQKMLYHIKAGKNTKKHYNRAEELLLRFKTQKPKEGEKYEEWNKRKLTKNKVLGNLKRILRDQHKIERDEIKLVKTNYGLKLKAYNRKRKIELGKFERVKEISFNDMILNESYPFNDTTYEPLFKKKLKQYKQQDQSFKEAHHNSSIGKWLDNLVIKDKLNNNEIRLNNMQKRDTNLMLQKNYGYLQWEQGSGKSISAIAQILYRQRHNNIRNTFIVAPAIAIKNNWNDILEAYGIPFRNIRTLEDVNNIQQGEVITITFNMLVKYEKFIKKYIKLQSRKVMLVLDEADNISNLSSKRYKATLSTFRKVKYKLLMSGTSTRNNIVEAFSAFELLYNSSINLLCDCETIYVENKKTKEIENKDNDKHMIPFPSYKKGQLLFKRCYNPDKQTVFGVGKQSQNVYNSESLKLLIDKTMITRSFVDVVGKNLYNIEQDTCNFNSNETDLYKTIIDEFYKIVGMYRSTGNARKDAILRIIQQLNSLLTACVTPNKFNTFNGHEMPSKAKLMLNKLNEWDNEIVSIGCTHIDTVKQYARYIREEFPDRPLFIITGNTVTLEQRKKIVEQLKETKNGILISTMQSLSSSMNIDFVNKIMVVELLWNYAAISQYVARYIRYTSTEQKDVHFLTVKNSIESNLLKLIMSKEKLVLFMKNDEVEDDELYERFGVYEDIFSMLLEKEVDQEGKSYIAWGKQKFVG